jgi:hypothetical protein
MFTEKNKGHLALTAAETELSGEGQQPQLTAHQAAAGATHTQGQPGLADSLKLISFCPA